MRRFHLIEKGKVEGGIQPQVFNGKESLATERRQSGLKVVDKSSDDLVSKSFSYLSLVNCYSLFEVDKFVLSESLRNCFHDVICDEKPIDIVQIVRQTPNMIICANGFSLKVFSLFDYVDHVQQFLRCVKSLNLCKSVLMNVKNFDCLIRRKHQFSWFGMIDAMTKMKPLLHFGVNKQIHVFKLGLYYFSLVFIFNFV